MSCNMILILTMFVMELLHPACLLRIQRQKPSGFLANYFGRGGKSDRCMKYDYNREMCKQELCKFSCTDYLCTAEKDSCADTCYDHCFDPCDCKQRGCEYNSLDFTCRKFVKHCNPLQFEEGGCFHGGSFYFNKGNICFNAKDNGVCDVKIISAVNFNGPTMTDSKGIRFVSDKEAGDLLQHGIENALPKVATEPVKGIADEDQQVYSTYITATEESEEACLGILAPISEPGLYEFVLKAAEMDFEGKAERLLKIVVNGQAQNPVINALDTLSYVECDHGIDIVIKFVVYIERKRTQKSVPYFEIPGFPAQKVPKEGISFTVCRTSCEHTTDKNLPIVSAMYVARISS